MVNQAAVRQQDIRDLKTQIDELRGEDEGEIIFRDTSPVRRRVTLYSKLDGADIQIPRNMLERILEKRQPNGEYMFTARQEEAPVYKRGNVKCFLHPQSPERPILEEIGLGGKTCTSAHLASLYSKRIHGLHRHKDEWAALQEYLAMYEKNQSQARQDAQLQATLDIARRVGAPVAATPVRTRKNKKKTEAS